MKGCCVLSEKPLHLLHHHPFAEDGPCWVSPQRVPTPSAALPGPQQRHCLEAVGLHPARPWANTSVCQPLPRPVCRDRAWKHRQQRGVMYRASARAGIQTRAPVTEASSALSYREGHFILVVSPFLFVYCFPGLAHVPLPWARYCSRNPVQIMTEHPSDFLLTTVSEGL